MNATFKIEIPNLVKLQDAFKKAPEIAGVEFARGINIALANIMKLAVDVDGGIFQFKTPRSLRTGYLNQSFGNGMKTATPSNLIGSIGPTVKYARFVEFGTPAHIIKASNKKGLANKKTGQFFGRTVHHPGTQANPFLERIRDASMSDANNQMAIALERVIKQITI